MKKCFLVLAFCCLLVSLTQAQLLIGGKAGGMGGAGVANVDDLAAAYYNPAALMRSGIRGGELKISAGTAYTDPTELSNSLANANDVAQFLADNYATNLTFNGRLDGVVGLNIRNAGITFLPVATASLSKPADTLVGTMAVDAQYAAALTLGQTYTVPFLPASLDVGINAKAISAYRGGITTTGTATNASGTRSYDTGSGIGFDVGVLTSFDVPYVTNFKAGIVARDLAQSVSYSGITQVSTLEYSITGTATVAAGPEVPTSSSVSATPSYAIGASATVPGINLGLAGDLEMVGSGTNTHLGIEYPLLFNTVILRAGTASGANLSKTTVGAKINLPIFELDAVSITDANNAGATSYLVDVNIGW